MTVLVVHGAAGLIAKSLALNHNWYGVSLESPQYSRSVIQAFFSSSKSKGEYNNYNLFSGKSLLTMAEQEVRFNYEMTDSQSYLNPASSSETMCLLMGAYVNDDRFDELCKQLVGFDQYKEYFGTWGRTRLEDM